MNASQAAGREGRTAGRPIRRRIHSDTLAVRSWPMSSRLKRRFALILLALLAFAQVNVALAGCFRDRASMMPASAANSDPGAQCDGCDVPVSKLADHISNACVVHCTSDLQLAGEPFVVVLSAADMPRSEEHTSELQSRLHL